MLLFSPDYLVYTLLGIVLIPGFLLAGWAETKVHNAFNTYSAQISYKGIRAYELVNAVNQNCNLGLTLTRCRGHLSDHYNPRTQQIALSNDVFDSSSIAALGVTAHELGHALQYKANYIPAKFRQILIPVVNFTSSLMWPIIIVAMLMEIFMPFSTGNTASLVLMCCGIGFFAANVLISLITLPTELDASKRAMRILKDGSILLDDELAGAKKVLSAAAMTYFASLLMSLLQLLRVLLFFMIRNRDDSN